MIDLFFSGPNAWFGIPAVAGTLIILVRVALMMLGGAGLDFGDDTSPASGGFEAHGDTSDGFNVLSVQALSAFAMGFGWAGLAAHEGSGVSWGGSIIAGLAGGVAITWLLALLMRGAHNLQSSGNVHIAHSIGQRGRVEVLIPAAAKGQGRVTLVLSGNQRSFYATTQGPELPTGTPVLVRGVNDDNSLDVSPVSTDTPFTTPAQAQA